MSRSHLRPVTGPLRLAMAVGHEGAMTYALMDGAVAHINAPLEPGLGERLGNVGRAAANMLGQRGRPSAEGWAPAVPEWADAGEPTSHGYTLVENIAVMDIEGALMARGFQGYWSGCYWPGYRDYVAALEAANADDRVDAIFERYDTPGGYVSGLYEAVDARRAVNAANGGKPIVGYVSELCASAGMALASQCDQLFAGDGAVVGSIGTRVLYFDMEGAMERWGERAHIFKSGRLKDMGAWWRPPTDEESKLVQLEIDHLADRFYQALAEGRGLDLAAIRKHHGWEAQCFTAGDPPPPSELDPMRADVGLIDGVMSEEEAFRTAQALAQRHAGSAQSPLSPGAAVSRADRDREHQAAGQTPREDPMKKLSAQLAALLAKKDAGTITTAEAEDLEQTQALFAPDAATEAADDADEEEAEGDDEETEAADDANEEEAEGDDEETEAADDADEEDKAEARAAAVFGSTHAKGRTALAARLAGRAAAGKISVKEAIADLQAAPRHSALDERMAAAAERRGAKPGGRKQEAAVNPLLADAMSRNPKLRDQAGKA